MVRARIFSLLSEKDEAIIKIAKERQYQCKTKQKILSIEKEYI